MYTRRKHDMDENVQERLVMVSETEKGDKKTLGIIGGMGPLATADLFYKLILLTSADTDEGHIHIVIDNNPKIPDRTKAVLDGSDAPFAYILKAAQKLEHMGADILLLPCNTTHIFYQRLCESVHVPVINMIEEAAKQVAAMKFGKVGLLATSGTLYAKLYENALGEYDIETVLPSARGQADVMALIYNGVKAGADTFDTAALNEELRRMMAKGAETFILGCTELPVAFQKYGIAFPFVDPGVILAKAAIIQAGYPIKTI
ncbi:MAG: amino acid racemase [Eubacteriales bacterium]|nr:amino acid racemase [Eubacteriales bacterium]